MTKIHPIQKEIDQLGLDQTAYSKLVDVTPQAVRSWLVDKQLKSARNRPVVIALYTKLLLDNPDLLPQAWVNAGYPPEGPPMSKAGRPVEREDKA